MRMTLYWATGSKSAAFFMFCQRQNTKMTAKRRDGVWIPKSQFKIISQAPSEAWKWNECEVEVSDWFAKKENLIERQAQVIAVHCKKDTGTAEAPSALGD